MHYATGNQIGIVLEDIVDYAGRRQVPVGTITPGVDNYYPNVANEYVYAHCVPAVTKGQCVYLDTYNGCVLADSAVHANDGGQVAWAIRDMPGSSVGWFQVSGLVIAKCAASIAANSKVFLSATPGQLDDAPLPGCQIMGAEFEAADGVLPGFAPVTCNRPTVQGQIT